MLALYFNTQAFGISQSTADNITSEIISDTRTLSNNVSNLSDTITDVANNPISGFIGLLIGESPVYNSIDQLEEDAETTLSKISDMTANIPQLSSFAMIDVGLGCIATFIAFFTALIFFIGASASYSRKIDVSTKRAKKCLFALTFAHAFQILYIVLFNIVFRLSDVPYLKYVQMKFPIISLIFVVLCILLLKFPQLTELKAVAGTNENGETEKPKSTISFKLGWKCDNCGNQNSNSDKFCTACGFANANESTTVYSVTSKVTQVAKNTADKVKTTVSSIPKPDISNVVEKLKTTTAKIPVPTSRNKDDKNFEKLKQLKELLDMGILTQEEFEQKKKEILKLQ